MERQKRLLRSIKKVHDNHHKSVVLVLIRSTDGDGIDYGSGFIIKSTEKSALVVTCSHVIPEGKNVRVRLAGGVKEYSATVVYEDTDADLAILRVQDMPSKYPELLFREKDIRIGKRVFLVAYFNSILLAGLRLDSDVYPGRISGRLRNYLLNPEFTNVVSSCRSDGGCSGGPLVYKGRVIGVNFTSRMGMTYAISTETFNKVLKKWLGIPNQEDTSIQHMIDLIQL